MSIDDDVDLDNPGALGTFEGALGRRGQSFNATRLGGLGGDNFEIVDVAGTAAGSGEVFNRDNVVQNFRPYFADASDGYANQHQYFVTFQHVPSQNMVNFKAFIGAFNETYKCNWGAESVFGRIDPIYSFKSTDRNITLNLNLPASTESEAYENLAKIGLLSDMLYPNYTNLGQANTISQSPMVRIKVMNLLESQGTNATGRTFEQLATSVNSSPAKGLLGVITSLNINHNLDNADVGVFEMGRNAILPKFIDISVSFDVIHEHKRGWNRNTRGHRSGPYGIAQTGEIQDRAMSMRDTDASNRGLFRRAERMQQRADQDDARQIASQEEANADARTVSLSRSLRERGASRRQDRRDRRGARLAGLSIEQYHQTLGDFEFARDDSENGGSY